MHNKYEPELNTLVKNKYKSEIVKTFPQITLDKELIEKLLEINTNNIPPAKAKITQYSKLMESGRWCYNGDSIRVSKSGVLLDGQNRLMAAKLVGKTLVCDLVVGLNDDVFTTIDTGRIRRSGHIIARQFNNNDEDIGASDSNTLSTAITKVLRHDCGFAQSIAINDMTSRIVVTPDVIMNYINENPEILEQLRYLKANFGSRTVIPQSTILYMLHITSRFNEDYAKKYLQKLIKGIGLKENETLQLFNAQLHLIKSKSAKWTKSEVDQALIKIWNSVARNGAFSIKYAGNMKPRKDESHIKFKEPSDLAIKDMLNIEPNRPLFSEL